MAFTSNMHTHTHFSDGKNTVEEMVLEAIANNFVSLGISDHSHMVTFDGSMQPEDMAAYFAEIARVREKYAGQIEVYAGIEWDSYSDPAILENFTLDYKIGSVHDLEFDGKIYSTDDDLETYEKILGFCSNKPEVLCKTFYHRVNEMVKTDTPDIVGHLDIIKKFNRGNRFFDESAPWYEDLWRETVDVIGESGAIIEINTGGMARGYVTSPYPSDSILRYILEKKVPLTLSSDTHDRKTMTWAFEETEERLRALGGKSLMRMEGGTFKETQL